VCGCLTGVRAVVIHPDDAVITHQATVALGRQRQTRMVGRGRQGGGAGYDVDRAKCHERELGEWLRQNGVGERTQKVYGGRVAAFGRFLKDAGLPQQVTGNAVAQYVKARVEYGVRLSTVEGDVAALQREVQLEGGDLFGDTVVQLALKCAGRLAQAGGVVQKLPLLREHMEVLLGQVAQERDAFVRCRDAALWGVGWAGMLRVSELVGLRWEHVKIFEQGLMLYMPRSKTDQAGEGAWVFIARVETRRVLRQLDPVGAMRRLAELVGRPLSGPVFPARVGASEAMSKTTVAVRLRRYLVAAGVRQPELYAPHSLRRGGATEAARQGLSLRQIQVLGRWKSDVVRQYVYVSPARVWEQSLRLLRGRR